MVELWIMHYGVPEKLITDLGGEFEGDWNMFCEAYGIDSRVAAAHSQWMNGIAERHGKILGTVWDKLCQQFDVRNTKGCKRTLAIAVQAKNATLTRNGITAEQAVFGRALRWSETANADDDEIMMSVLGNDGPAWLEAQMRAAARIAMISRDASEKIRRAMMRRAPVPSEEL